MQRKATCMSREGEEKMNGGERGNRLRPTRPRMGRGRRTRREEREKKKMIDVL